MPDIVIDLSMIVYANVVSDFVSRYFSREKYAVTANGATSMMIMNTSTHGMTTSR